MSIGFSLVNSQLLMCELKIGFNQVEKAISVMREVAAGRENRDIGSGWMNG